MNKHLLNKYFKNQCTDDEKESVEEWILNQDNRSTFENYIEKQWNDFEIHPKQSKSSSTFTLSKSIAWKIAATVLLFASVAAYTFNKISNEEQSSPLPTQSVSHIQNNTIDKNENAKLENNPISESLRKENTPRLAKIKTVKDNIKPITEEKATVEKASANKSVSASKIGHLSFNEKLLSELSSQIDSNKLVLTMNMREERFEEIAELLKSKYQIILEPIKTGGEKNMYAARFEKTNIPELLKLMEDKIAFTYNLRDSILQINL